MEIPAELLSRGLPAPSAMLDPGVLPLYSQSVCPWAQSFKGDLKLYIFFLFFFGQGWGVERLSLHFMNKAPLDI